MTVNIYVVNLPFGGGFNFVRYNRIRYNRLTDWLYILRKVVDLQDVQLSCRLSMQGKSTYPKMNAN